MAKMYNPGEERQFVRQLEPHQMITLCRLLLVQLAGKLPQSVLQAVLKDLH